MGGSLLVNFQMLYKVFAFGIVAFGACYLAYSYALNRTALAVRLKRKGCYRCPQYQHKIFLTGSDYRNDVAAAAAEGTRADWTRRQFAKYGKTFETSIWANEYSKLVISSTLKRCCPHLPGW